MSAFGAARALLVLLCAWTCAGARTAHAESPEAAACVSAHVEGQRLRQAGSLLAARAALLRCAQRECPELVANDCGQWLPEVEADLSSVVLAVDGGEGRDLVDVRVFANGKLLTERADGRALALDPGAYRFRFEAPGFQSLTLAASIRQAEKNRIVRARLEPALDGDQGGTPASVADDSAPGPAASGGRSVPVLTYVFGGVSLASFGAFAYFAIDGKNEYERLDQTCAKNGMKCSNAQVADGKRAYVIADVALGVGIASAATAAILFFTAGDDDPPAAQDSATLEPVVSARGAALRLTYRH